MVLAKGKGVISLAGKVTAGLVESNGTAAYHPVYDDYCHLTCGLTAKRPGSAPCLTLIIEYGTTLLYAENISGHVSGILL